MSIRAVIYVTSTGEIKKNIVAEEETIALQLLSGESYLEVSAYCAESIWYIDVTGTPTLASKGTQPTPFHVWNYTTSAWELPSGSKEAAFEQLRTEYTATVLGMKYSPIEAYSSDSYLTTNIYYADTEWRYRYANPGTMARSGYELDTGSIVFLGADGVYHYVGIGWFTADVPGDMVRSIRIRDQLLDNQLIIALLALQDIVDDPLGTVQDLLDYVPSFVMPEHPYE